MANNLFDQLAEVEVPSPPENFETQVHDRLNGRLLLGQLMDLAVRGLPFVFLHMTQAIFSAIRFTLTGTHEDPPRQDPH